jgi:hypothetical protein
MTHFSYLVIFTNLYQNCIINLSLNYLEKKIKRTLFFDHPPHNIYQIWEFEISFKIYFVSFKRFVKFFSKDEKQFFLKVKISFYSVDNFHRNLRKNTLEKWAFERI